MFRLLRIMPALSVLFIFHSSIFAVVDDAQDFNSSISSNDGAGIDLSALSNGLSAVNVIPVVPESKKETSETLASEKVADPNFLSGLRNAANSKNNIPDQNIYFSNQSAQNDLESGQIITSLPVQESSETPTDQPVQSLDSPTFEQAAQTLGQAGKAFEDQTANLVGLAGLTGVPLVGGFGAILYNSLKTTGAVAANVAAKGALELASNPVSAISNIGSGVAGAALVNRSPYGVGYGSPFGYNSHPFGSELPMRAYDNLQFNKPYQTIVTRVPEQLLSPRGPARAAESASKPTRVYR